MPAKVLGRLTENLLPGAGDPSHDGRSVYLKGIGNLLAREPLRRVETQHKALIGRECRERRTQRVGEFIGVALTDVIELGVPPRSENAHDGLAGLFGFVASLLA
jgi:hypothetical protein